MPGSINGAVRQDIQSIYARGMDSSACATERPAFINLVTEGRNDPIALFKQQPHQTVNAKELVLHEAQKNLPADFLQKELSPEGNKIRTLIGVIYKDVQDSGNAEDLAKLDKVCKKLAEASGNENKEQKVAKELSGLVSKYSAGAFDKVINKYIEHCMEAWEDHHQAKSVDTHDKAIFTQCLDVCKSTLKHDVEGLAQPDQPWETMAQKLNFFVNDCAAISKTLTFYDAEPVTPAPKGPETLNPNPDGGADNQRVFIPTGPGQGGITLNITSQGGSVGDITHSVGAANTAPADSNSAIVKHILDSGLTNVEKVGLIKDLFNAGIGGGSNFLGNLVGVQGYKQEQDVDTPQQNVARREIETQAPKPELKSIATQTEGVPETETVNDASLGPEPKVQQQPTIVVEQNRLKTAFDGEASKTQDAQNLEADNFDGVVLREKKEPSGRTSLSNGDFIYTTSRNIDPLNRRSSAPTHFIPLGPETKPERASEKVVTLTDKFEALKQRDPSAFAHLDKQDAQNLEADNFDGVVLREKKEPSGRTSLSNGDFIYTTSRNIDPLNRRSSTPTHFIPLGPETKPERASEKVVTLTDKFEALKQRDPSVFAHLDKQDAQNLEADNFDGVVLREKKEPSGRTSLSNGDFIYTTSRNIDPLNRRSSTPTHFIPLGPETKPERASEKVVTLTDKFEALKQRDPSVFAHLDKNGAVTSEGEKAKPTAEHHVEKSSTDSLIRPEPAPPLNPQVRSDGSAANRAPASIKTANPDMDSTDGGMLRKNGEEVSRKSAADGFQPTRINAAAVNMPGNRSGNDHVYTTVRTVNSWNREPKPVSFVPKGSQSDSAELDAVLSRFKRRDESAFETLENKSVEQDKEKLPFQEKLAEFIRRREQ